MIIIRNIRVGLLIVNVRTNAQYAGSGYAGGY